MASTNIWRKWLPQDDVKLLENIEILGSYTTKLTPGFRIISLNMNYCYKENYYNFLNLTDPNGILSWLINELQTAENNHELVHIIGHIPSGHDCTEVN